jgi:hypothetical protein
MAGKKTQAEKAAKKKAQTKKPTPKKAKAKKKTQPETTAASGGGRVVARRGDAIVIPSQRVGSPPREGEILRIVEGEVSVSYEVRWADGHQSLLSPGSGNFEVVRPAGREG